MHMKEMSVGLFMVHMQLQYLTSSLRDNLSDREMFSPGQPSSLPGQPSDNTRRDGTRRVDPDNEHQQP